MALSKQTLQDDIRTTLQKAMVEEWSLDEVAAAWAEAIHKFVSSAAVTGVNSDVSVDVPLTGPSPARGTGTATQSNRGKLE